MLLMLRRRACSNYDKPATCQMTRLVGGAAHEPQSICTDGRGGDFREERAETAKAGRSLAGRTCFSGRDEEDLP